MHRKCPDILISIVTTFSFHTYVHPELAQILELANTLNTLSLELAPLYEIIVLLQVCYCEGKG